MMEWFRSGGFGMILVLILGAGSIGFGVKAMGKPTAERIAWLRSLPGLIIAAAIFTFGFDMWAVNRAVSDEAFLKAHNVQPAEVPVMALVGATESVQVFTLAGLLAMAVIVLKMLAEAKKARSEAD